MDVLTMVGQLILALAILITLHELGHFWAARFFGIRVEKFFLFFDAWGLKLFSFKKGDTEYGIGWLPLGGYVKIAGMIDESMDQEQLKTPAQPWEFRSKPAWQRLIVMLGGVTVNAILGITIMAFSLMYYGDEYLPNANAKYGIHAYPLGKKVGFMDGDKLLSINGKPIEKFNEAIDPKLFVTDGTTYLVDRNGEQVSIVLDKTFADLYSKAYRDSGFIDANIKFKLGEIRNGTPASKADLKKGDYILAVDDTTVLFYQQLKPSLKAEQKQVFTILRGNDTLRKTLEIGKELIVGFNTDFYEMDSLKKVQYFSFGQSFPEGAKRSKALIGTQMMAYGKMFKGEMDPRKSLAGPIQIGKMFGSTWEWERFWAFTAAISIVLAFFNLLPIPALDGGHVLFLIVEIIIRRPLPEKFMYVMQVIGMVILLSLMVFIFGNDIFQTWFNK